MCILVIEALRGVKAAALRARITPRQARLLKLAGAGLYRFEGLRVEISHRVGDLHAFILSLLIYTVALLARRLLPQQAH